MRTAVDGLVVAARRISPDANVLPEDWLRYTEAPASSLPRFADNVWDLSAGIPQRNAGNFSTFLDFGSEDPRWVETLKCFAWCALHHDRLAATGEIHALTSLGTKLGAVPPVRLKRELRWLRSYLRFLDQRQTSISKATHADQAAWLNAYREASWSTRFRAYALPARLALYAEWLPAVAVLPNEPWVGSDVIELIGRAPPPGENSTPRIPRHVIDPALNWALFFLGDGFDDLMEAIFPREDYRSGRTTLLQGPAQALPGTSTAWISQSGSLGNYAHGYLIAAAYLVTAYLSGMRDGEVQALREGCTSTKRQADGRPYRHLVEGTAFKTQSGFPVERTWIVLEEVHNALSRLSAFNQKA
jgi:hypothetical protein